MRIPLFQVDAFADRLFTGNLTAFFVAEGSGYRLRWFTPATEVDLCGHATLASAYVVMNCLGVDRDVVSFQTRSGELTVERRGDLYVLDSPRGRRSAARCIRGSLMRWERSPLRF